VTSHAKQLRDGLHPFALHSQGDSHTTPEYLGHLWSGFVWFGSVWFSWVELGWYGFGPYPQPISVVYLTFPPDTGLLLDSTSLLFVFIC